MFNIAPPCHVRERVGIWYNSLLILQLITGFYFCIKAIIVNYSFIFVLKLLKERKMLDLTIYQMRAV